MGNGANGAGDGGSGQAVRGSFEPATSDVMPSHETTHVHLLRHGETVDLERRVVRGQMEVDVSPAGRTQAERLVRWYAQHVAAPERVFTSDLARCRELADELGRALERPVHADERLREQSMGRWEGQTWVELTAAEPDLVTAYWDDYYRTAPSGGESVKDLDLRVRGFWDATLAACAGQRIAIVTHIGVIRVLLCHFLRLPATESLRFAPATASHTEVTLSEAGAVVTCFGERPWLFVDARPGAGAGA
jgi:broad specificity phosphatase PhoE